MKLRYVFFETFFYRIGYFNLLAERAEKAGKHEEAARLRTGYQRMAGLTDAEGEILQEIAHNFNCAVNAHDAKLNALAETFRAQMVPGATVTVSTDFYQAFEERKRIVIDHVEQLRVGLGETSFKNLEALILPTNPAPDEEAKPKSPSATTTVKSEKERH